MPLLRRRAAYRNYRIDQGFGQPFTLNKHSPQAQGLVFWLPLTGNAGRADYFTDMVSGFVLSKVNTPNWITNAERGLSLNFDRGSSEYLTVAAPVLGAAPLTMSCWFRSVDATVTNTLMELGVSGVNNNRFTTLANGASAGNPIQAATRDTSAVTASSTTGYSANQWHLATSVFTSPALRAAYIDGGSKGTNTTSRTPTGISDTAIGRSFIFGNYIDGLIADVRIYNRALTDSEVYKLYAPATRWDLYQPLARAFFMRVPAAVGGTILPQMMQHYHGSYG